MTLTPLARRIVLVLGALCVVHACADTRAARVRQPRTASPPATPAPAPANVIVTAPVRDECFGSDPTESSAMSCAAGAVSRIADTLQILLSNGRVVRRVDAPQDAEGQLSYRYEGRIGGSSGGPAYHVLDYRGDAGGGAELINAQTGDSLLVTHRPRISPDGARMLVDDMRGMEVDGGHVVLQIWRITGDRPVSEYDLHPYVIGTGTGWGPSKVEWRSADTITFLRNRTPRDSLRAARSDWDTTRSILVHKPTGWVLDPRR